jgi:AcrR family transcriptional regulator
VSERANSKNAENSQFRSRRTEIVDVAATLFARKGYSATGIREIGDAVGLDRGGLYYYIGSKESLLEEIHDRVLDPLLESTREIAALDVSAMARLCLISEALVRIILEHRDHVRVFLHEYRAFTGTSRERFRKKRQEYELIILELLELGNSGGEFNFTNLQFTAMAFMGMHNYTYQWVGNRTDVDPVELSATYCDVFFKGIVKTSLEASPHLSLST